ncbi:MAG: zinc-binding dehydrogenase [Clostridiales bacterium]|nr:zinc-binding dehydrogenase [Clostridiales bacterium]
MKAVTFSADLPTYLLTTIIGKINKKLYYSGISCTRYTKDVIPPVLPGEDWVKLQTVYGGICGSDLGLVFLHDSPLLSPFASKKFIIGHENLGEIVEIGKNVIGFKIGDRVVADDVLSCETRGLPLCPCCQAGDYNLCHNFTEGKLSPGTIIGSCGDTGGSWGEYYVAHRSRIFKVPENVTDKEAILIDPLCSALHPVLRNFPNDNEKVLIIGAGIIGQLLTASLRAFGSKANITVISRHSFQAELAEGYGATQTVRDSRSGIPIEQMADITGGKILKPILGDDYLIGGFDRIFDCVGSASSIKDSLRFINSPGTLVVVGLVGKIKLDWTLFWLKEVTLRGIYGYAKDSIHYVESKTNIYKFRDMDKTVLSEGEYTRHHTYQIGLDIMTQKKLNLEQLVTHVFSLDKYKQALKTASDKSSSHAVKVLLKP